MPIVHPEEEARWRGAKAVLVPLEELNGGVEDHARGRTLDRRRVAVDEGLAQDVLVDQFDVATVGVQVSNGREVPPKPF